jgi:hypothetical protein
MSDASDNDDNPEVISMAVLRTWLVKDLKEWCKERKLNISGKKEILAQRVYRAMTFRESDSENDGSSDNEDGMTDIDLSRPSTWVAMTTDDIPPVRIEDVRNYFIFHKNPISGKLLNFNRQLKKAKKFAKERYISNIETGQSTSQKLTFIRARSKAMLPTTYAVSVSLVKETGMVHSGECTCKAGQSGVCSHTGALLLTLLNTRAACTSQLCGWKGPAVNPLKLEPALFRDIRIYNPEKDSENEKSRPYPGVYSAGPKVSTATFAEDLLDAMKSFNTDCALYQSLRCHPGDISNFVSLFDVKFQYANNVSLSDDTVQQTFRTFVDNLAASEELLSNLEQSTRGQGVNPNWMKARRFLITASLMGDIVKRQKAQLDAIVRRIMYSKPVVGVKSLAYGTRMEAKARREYARWHMKKCGGIIVEDRGLIVKFGMPFLGASIDGLVKCDQCGDSIVEIKCPYGRKYEKWRSMSPADCTKSSTFCCTMEQDTIRLKPEHNYAFQVQGQMAVCQLPWVDFVIWTKKGMSVQRINRDQDLWSNRIVPKLREFYTRGIVLQNYSHYD